MKLRQSEHLILLSKTGQQMARGVELEDDYSVDVVKRKASLNLSLFVSVRNQLNQPQFHNTKFPILTFSH